MMRESIVESENAIADARRESDRAGDVFYSMLTAWMVSRLSNGSGSKCLELALAYDMAIDRLIDRLKQQVISTTSQRGIMIAIEQKSLLEGDLNYLGKEFPPLPNTRQVPAEPLVENEEVGRIAQAE